MSKDLCDEYTCPICFEIPEKEVYQCVNGHIVCHECSTHIEECPQCKELFGDRKIRNRALEGILARKVDCPNKCFGCRETISQKDVSSHLCCCKYGGSQVQICTHMGYTCEYVTDSKNIPDAIHHFQSEHSGVKVEASSGKVILVDFKFVNLQSSSVFTPYIFQKESTHFLIFVNIIGLSQTMSLTCIHLKQYTELDNCYGVEYKFLTERNFLEYRTIPLELSNVMEALINPTVEILGNTLKKNYIIKKHLEIMVSIQSDVINNLADLSKTENNVWLAFNEIQDNRVTDKQDDQITWYGIYCDSCKTKPIIGARHTCLQCRNFDLCNDCMDKKVHPEHLFTSMTTDAQYYAVFKAKWNLTPRDYGYTPVLLDIKSPIFCTHCQSNEIQRNAAYFCLDCNTLRGYCVPCYSDSTAKKDCKKHLLLKTPSNTVIKACTDISWI